MIDKKNARDLLGVLLGCASLLGAVLIATPAQAAPTATQQVLDRVFTFGPTRVIDMATGNASQVQPFTDLNITGGNFITCALTAVNGLYCLDGAALRNWPNPDDYTNSAVVLSCTDAKLELDRKSICTGMTVDQSGAIWLAGKKHNAHSVIKVVPTSLACTDAGGRVLDSNPALCALDMYSGRPVLVDISPVDGDSAKVFPWGAGVLAVEARRDAYFYPDAAGETPKPLVSGKQWGLVGKEEVQQVTLLQLPNGSGVYNYLVATTSTGRLLAKEVSSTANPVTVYNVPKGAVQCDSSEQQFGIRASSTASILYVSDRNYCQVLALKPDENGNGMVSSTYPMQLDFVLSTAYYDSSPTVLRPAIGIAVAPGISILLTTCKVGCTLANTSSGTPGTRLQSLQLVDESNSGATVFQVKGIPDCRYEGYNGFHFEASLATLCSQPGVLVKPDALGFPDPDGGSCGLAPCPAAALWLNVTPLLPSQVTSAFAAKGYGELPALLVSPPYRGQLRNDFTFEALFVLTDKDIKYRNVFTGEYDVPGLEGVPPPDLDRCIANPADLLAWDLVTTVSEYHPGYGGEHVDMLTNSDCGSTKTVGVRLSLLPYDLELAPDTWGPTVKDGTKSSLTSNNDAVFARLMQRLYGELSYAQQHYACVPDGSVLPGSTCGSLDSTWLNGKQKLDKCISAGFQPKQSAGSENCQSFISQLGNYGSLLPAETPTGDKANRVGELKARITTLLHVYYTRYLPSIPDNGFCQEWGTCSSP